MPKSHAELAIVLTDIKQEYHLSKHDDVEQTVSTMNKLEAEGWDGVDLDCIDSQTFIVTASRDQGEAMYRKKEKIKYYMSKHTDVEETVTTMNNLEAEGWDGVSVECIDSQTFVVTANRDGETNAR